MWRDCPGTVPGLSRDCPGAIRARPVVFVVCLACPFQIIHFQTEALGRGGGRRWEAQTSDLCIGLSNFV